MRLSYGLALESATKGLSLQTIAYRDRVIADGGTIVDLAYVDSIYKTLNNKGILSSLKVWISPNCGVKISAGKVTKLYNLLGSYDAEQSDSAKQATTATNSRFNNKYTLSLSAGQSYYIANLPLPTYIDGFVAFRTIPTATAYMILEHGVNAGTNDGFQYLPQQGRYGCRRSGALHFINRVTDWAVCCCWKLPALFQLLLLL